MYMAKGVDNFTIKYAEYDTTTQKVLWNRSTEGSPGGIRTNAFKFEFTLYDSKGFIKNGRTFTHIIFLGS
jgi:hypothetical protein